MLNMVSFNRKLIKRGGWERVFSNRRIAYLRARHTTDILLSPL